MSSQFTGSPSKMFLVRRRVASEKGVESEKEDEFTLPAFERTGENAGDWQPTDALAYYVLDTKVLKGEVVDDSGLREDVEGGRWVLTSPNDPVLVLPALGVRSPRRFKDGHFGYDDFSRWPQFFTSQFQHHPFVPRYSKELARLWWAPSRDECAVIPGAVDRDVRVLDPSIVQELKVICNDCCDKAALALQTHQEDRAPLWITIMCDTLDRLSMGLSYRSIIHEVGEFQRHCLETLGWLNFVNTFQPRMLRDGVDDKTHHPIDKSVMGAFTHKVAVAQLLFRIGVPVYLLRPSSVLPPNMNVKSSEPTSPRRVSLEPNVPPVIVDDFDTLKGGPWPFPVMRTCLPGARLQEGLQQFRVSLSSGEQATAIGAIEEKKLAEERRLAQPGEEDKVEVLTKIIPLKAFVYSKKRITSSTDPVMTSALEPSLFDVQCLEIWNKILSRFPQPCPPGLATHCKGMPMPNPQLLAHSSKNRRLYAAAWLAIRADIVDRLLAALEANNTVFPKGQDWRNFLHSLKFHFDDPSTTLGKKRQPLPSSSDDHDAKRQRVGVASSQARSVKQGQSSRQVKGQIILNSLPLREHRVTEMCWVDRRITIRNQEDLAREMTDDLISEIAWDLHEHNFRFELNLLDHVLCPQEYSEEVVPLPRELKLRRVFPEVDGRLGSVYLSKIPNVDAGITSRCWKERARYFLAFRELMLDWPNCNDALRSCSLGKGEWNMHILENLVIEEYCTQFVRHFGRLPVAPLRLPFASLRRPSPASFYAGLFARRDSAPGASSSTCSS